MSARGDLSGGAVRPPSPLRHRNFALFVVTMLASTFAGQMVLLGIQWQVYLVHRGPLDLGLIGGAEFVGLLAAAFPSGQLADRLPRRLMLASSIVVNMVVAGLLLLVSLAMGPTLWPFLALALGAGAATAIGWPASRAMTPNLVPAEILQSALALRTMTMQISVIAAPALAGALLAVEASLVYGIALALLALGFCTTLVLRVPPVARVDEQAQGSMLANLRVGIRFVWRTPVLLGAIALDLFAVLFGGAIALAPFFAASILHHGAGLTGLLRAAPAAGALIAGIFLIRRPLQRRVGRKLLAVVAIFGASQIVFGVSRSIPLSLAALAIGGFVDMISMNIRSATVALATPDALRGRVNAVEMIFISASNELGAFESGSVAALFGVLLASRQTGTVVAVAIGGAITIGLAVVWGRLFPALAAIDRLEALQSEQLDRSAPRSADALARAAEQQTG